MKTRRLVMCLSVAVLLLAGVHLVATAAPQSSPPALLFEQAVHLEEAFGDAPGAVRLYRQVAVSAENKALAAHAELRLAGLYMKMRRTAEARAGYQRIVQRYSGNRELAAIVTFARAALEPRARTQSVATGSPSVKELTLEAGQLRHALSPDGTKVAYTNRKNHLVVRDLASGGERQLVEAKPGESAWQPIWSPDGKRIAYSYFQNYWRHEIRIVSIETGEEQHREVNGYPLDWSKDGRFILYGDFFGKPAPTFFLLLAAGGTPRTLDIDPSGLTPQGNFRFSPDSRYITYSARKDNNIDIYLVPIEDGAPIRVTDHPARDFDPIWAPDGGVLLFLSDRAFGRVDLWGVRMADRRPVGDPFIVRPDLGTVLLFSLSSNGRLLFQRNQSESDIYVTSIDAKTHQPIGRALRLASGGQLVWAPDGRRIAYLADDQGETRLRVIGVDGSGDEDIIAVQPFIGPFAWAPDNDHVYIAETRPDPGRGIYSISTSRKDRRPVLLDPEILGHVVLSADGKRLAFLRGLQHRQMYAIGVDGQNLRQLTSVERNVQVAYPAWSPDGLELAFAFTMPNAGKQGVMVVTLANGTVREIVSSTNAADRFGELSWSPDGKRLSWTSPDGTPDSSSVGLGAQRNEIRLLTSGEGTPQPFHPALEMPTRPSMRTNRWSPDGTKMAFVVPHSVYQLLLLENFLPISGSDTSGNAQTRSR